MLLLSLWSSLFRNIYLYLGLMWTLILEFLWWSQRNLRRSRRDLQAHVLQFQAMAAGIMPTQGFDGPVLLHTEPIVAYRAWKLIITTDGEAILRGIASASNYSWVDGATNVARHNGYQECPFGGIHRCGVCGFWAYNDPKYLSTLDTMPVIGKVSLWGDVVEGDMGYRGEKAYPEKLYVIERRVAYSGIYNITAEQVAAKLRDKYKVEVEVSEGWPQVVTAMKVEQGSDLMSH